MGCGDEAVKLFASDGRQSGTFGASVAVIDADTLLVGAPGGSLGGIFTGVVYIFQRGPSGWQESGKFTGSQASSGIRFGSGIHVSGDRIAVTAASISDAPWGGCYLFERSGTSWLETGYIPLVGGAKASLDGDRLLLGSCFESSAGQFAGMARLYELQAGSWVEVEVFQAEAPGPFQNFGLDVELQGDRALIVSRENGGRLYQYLRSPAGWISTGTMDVGHVVESNVDIQLDGDRVFVSNPLNQLGEVRVWALGPTEEVYCDALPNSTGSGARISVSSCNSVAGGVLQLRAGPVPEQPGLFYMGTFPVQVPFGGSYRCVGGTTHRLGVTSPAGGELVQQIDLDAPGSHFTSGSTWCLQAWFRDPGLQGSTFSLSDAVAVRFL